MVNTARGIETLGVHHLSVLNKNQYLLSYFATALA